MAPSILAAHYGGQDVTTLANVQFSYGEDLSVSTDELQIQDPWKNVRKSLSVIYRFDNGQIHGCVIPQDSGRIYTLSDDRRDAESEKITFIPSNYAPPDRRKVRIHAVIWGLSQVEDKEVYNNLYDKFARNESIPLTNGFFKKDTWVGIGKSAVIVYSFHGTLKYISGKEGNSIAFAY
ncbi:hypothetical protein G7Z17_g1568 [Cylindrodendrum hubeiense]|uniref:Uncharacterized protein n=1 Tax=Cylindrodendrum hubeiense TaxID=595255 RepID=A0A9P5LFA9_9HYPO|nr:hypothetical protein G7Z17_g1568 [Cylindrodendrum hubeiense]